MPFGQRILKMRVLHLETGRHRYGGAVQVLHLMQGLAGHGVTGTLVCPPDSAVAGAARARHLDVEPLPVSGDLDFGFISRFRQCIRRSGPDLVHVHSRRGADTLGGIAARLSGVPAILSRRVDSADLALLGRLKYMSYARVIAISGAIRDQLSGLGLPGEKLRLVRSGIDVAACQPSWTRERFLREFRLFEEDVPIAVVAQFIPRKGHAHLLAAIGQLRETASRVRVILFGEGPLRAELEQGVAQAGLISEVEFAGYRNDLLEFLGHFQLLVHPALREGLGVSLIEAQAAGVPVVAFDVGGVPEAVADGETGMLVPAGDSWALAEAIGGLVLNPVRRRHLANAGPDRVRAEFSVERMVRGNLAIYSEVLDGLGDESEGEH
jgi:glycosyltransferase involved in cell wall biosynthesis